MEHRHFLTALMGGAFVSVACFALYGVSAQTVIFTSQWGLVCFSWFVTTLKGTDAVVRFLSWLVLVFFILVIGRQIPYMLHSPSIGNDFYPFMGICFLFIASVMFLFRSGEKRK